MNYPIRILQVFSRMDRGGAESVIMNCYRKINRSKVQFDFVVHTNDQCAFDEEIRALGGRIFKMPRYEGKNHFEYIKLWHVFFNKHPEYKIIHGHYFTISALYLWIAKRYNLTCIAHSHAAVKGTLKILIKLAAYPLSYSADYLFACSWAAGLSLYGNSIRNKDKFHILNNAIDTEKFIYNPILSGNKKKQLGISGKYVVGHVGRFNPSKNHDFLIEIFYKLHEKNSSALLLLVGDGYLREKIEQKARELGLTESVIFTGIRSDVPDLMQAMDLFLFPSLHEGLGIAAVEAQAAGLKCIVADTIPEEAYLTNLIENESLKAPAEIWAERILKYANGYKRIDTSEKIKEKGYDIAETAKWLEEFYLKEHEKILSSNHY